jgi:ATP/maltotriose-dependent transcriptional regulator MalT
MTLEAAMSYARAAEPATGLDRATSRQAAPGERVDASGAAAAGRPGAQFGVASGHTAETLTPREQEVLRLLAQGRSNQAIATELIVAVGTVKRHVNRLFGKLGVQSRLGAMAHARALGLVE